MRWMDRPVVMRTMANRTKDDRYKRTKTPKMKVGLRSAIIQQRRGEKHSAVLSSPRGVSAEPEEREQHGGFVLLPGTSRSSGISGRQSRFSGLRRVYSNAIGSGVSVGCCDFAALRRGTDKQKEDLRAGRALSMIL